MTSISYLLALCMVYFDSFHYMCDCKAPPSWHILAAGPARQYPHPEAPLPWRSAQSPPKMCLPVQRWFTLQQPCHLHRTPIIKDPKNLTQNQPLHRIQQGKRIEKTWPTTVFFYVSKFDTFLKEWNNHQLGNSGLVELGCPWFQIPNTFKHRSVNDFLAKEAGVLRVPKTQRKVVECKEAGFLSRDWSNHLTKRYNTHGANSW